MEEWTVISEKIIGLIAEQFGMEIDEITTETSLKDDLGADSLDMVEIMMNLEEEFDLGEVDESVISQINTVGDIITFIQKTTD